jgi:hypothetical protein
MHLVLLYGPPAAGKLTVGTKLAALTGYTLLDNHRVTDYIPELFPRSEPKFDKTRTELGRTIRLLLFGAAARNDVNLISTFAPISKGRHDFIRAIVDTVQQAGGQVALVQLAPNQQELEHRVVSESRRGVKAETVERLHELIDEYPAMFETFPDFEHLVIDNSELTADVVARQIIEHYNLS